MALYEVLENDIHDAEAYERYKAAVTPMVKAAGGEYLVRDGAIDVLAGDWRPSRLVIFRWPDRAAADGFSSSPEYQPLKDIRLAASTTKVFVAVEGFDAPAAPPADDPGAAAPIYALLENEIHDPEVYERYKAAVKPMAEAAGAAYLTRDGAIDVLAGDWRPSRLVIFRWPSRAKMQAFFASEEYRPWKELRESVTTTKVLVVVEGV
ncbi:MAG: DUF1330 domain-containing protein [Pseudomonadota bacterium]